MKQLKNFRKTLTYQKRPIFEAINVDVSKRSDISDNTNLNISKNMDDSAHSFLFAEHTYGKKVIILYSKNLKSFKSPKIVRISMI